MLRDVAQRLAPESRLASPFEIFLALKASCPAGGEPLLDPEELPALMNRIRLFAPAGLTGGPGPLLLAWAKQYAAELSRRGLCDEAGLFKAAAKQAASAPVVALYGFYDLNPAQSGFVMALQGQRKIAAAWLPIPLAKEKAWGWRHESQPWIRALGALSDWQSLADESPPFERWLSVSDLDGAARAAAVRVLEADQPGIVCAAAKLDAPLREAFARAGNFAMTGDDLWNSAIGDAVTALLELPADDFAPATLARLLTGPHARDHALGAKFVRSLREGKRLRRPESEGLADAAFREIKPLYTGLPRSDAEAPIRNWAAALLGLLERFIVPRSVNAQAFCEALSECLHTLSEQEDSLRWNEFSTLLRREVRGKGEGAAAGLRGKLGEVNALRLIPCDELWILNLNEGDWQSPPPRWPVEWLAPLGYANQADSDRLRLGLLISSAKSVVRVANRRRNGEECWPHPEFIASLVARHCANAILGPLDGAENQHAGENLKRWLRGEITESRPNDLQFLAEWGEGLPQPARDARVEFQIARARQRRFGANLDWTGAALTAPAPGHAVSPSLLEAWGRCGFQGFARLLGVRERAADELREDGEAGETGSLVHAVLRDFYAGNDPAPPWNGRWDEAARARLGEIFARKSDRQLGHASVAALEIARLQAMLARYLAGEAAALRGVAPAGSYEYAFSEAQQEKLAAWLGVPAGGRVDRIERHPRSFVLDYKTGKPEFKPANHFKEFMGWQAPFYLAALQQCGEKPARFEFRYLKSNTPVILEANDAKLQNAIALLPEFSRAALSGPFAPLPDADGACKYCDLDEACGKIWRDAEEWEAAVQPVSIRARVAEELGTKKKTENAEVKEKAGTRVGAKSAPVKRKIS